MKREYGIGIRCWGCGKETNVREVAEQRTKLPLCCFKTLGHVAEAFTSAVLTQLPYHLPRMPTDVADYVAENAVTCSDPKTRAAAQEWRNRRAAEKSQGKG